MKYQPIFFDIEATSLNPMQQAWWDNKEHDAEAICIGVGTVTDWRNSKDEAEIHVNVISADSEYLLLDNAYEELVDWVSDVYEGSDFDMVESDQQDGLEHFLVGWNNRTYDHPYLGARFSRLRLEGYPFTQGMKRLDAMRAIKSKTGRYWSQDDWMETIGVAHEDDITGKDVPEMYKDGRIDKIRKHCYADIQDLAEIFLEDREAMMSHFYDHYDIDEDATFNSVVEVELDD